MPAEAEPQAGGTSESRPPYDVDDHLISLASLSARYSHSGINISAPDKSLGLSTEVAQRLEAELGPNTLTPPADTPEILKFLRHFSDVLILMLIFAAVLGFLAFGLRTADFQDIVIAGVLCLMVRPTGRLARAASGTGCACVLSSALIIRHRAAARTAVQVTLICSISYFQERQASNVMESIRTMLPATCRVRRDGLEQFVPARSLVVGDLVHLTLGSRVPADVRLVAAEGLRVEMASLTGEPDAVECTPDPKSQEPLRARNIAFNGSLVMAGSAYGVVVRTGDHTMLGRIARLASSTAATSARTTLQTEIHRVAVLVSVVALVTGLAFFIIALARGQGIVTAFSVGFIFVIISAVPEGLPPAVTSVLMLSARRLAARRVLVKRTDIVETLSACTVICTDKTGTLTQNRMQVAGMWLGGRFTTGDPAEVVMQAGGGAAGAAGVWVPTAPADVPAAGRTPVLFHAPQCREHAEGADMHAKLSLGRRMSRLADGAYAVHRQDVRPHPSFRSVQALEYGPSPEVHMPALTTNDTPSDGVGIGSRLHGKTPGSAGVARADDRGLEVLEEGGIDRAISFLSLGPREWRQPGSPSQPVVVAVSETLSGSAAALAVESLEAPRRTTSAPAAAEAGIEPPGDYFDGPVGLARLQLPLDVMPISKAHSRTQLLLSQRLGGRPPRCPISPEADELLPTASLGPSLARPLAAPGVAKLGSARPSTHLPPTPAKLSHAQSPVELAQPPALRSVVTVAHAPSRIGSAESKAVPTLVALPQANAVRTGEASAMPMPLQPTTSMGTNAQQPLLFDWATANPFTRMVIAMALNNSAAISDSGHAVPPVQRLARADGALHPTSKPILAPAASGHVPASAAAPEAMVLGDASETALARYVMQLVPWDCLRAGFESLHAVPFDSVNKVSLTVVRLPNSANLRIGLTTQLVRTLPGRASSATEPVSFGRQGSGDDTTSAACNAAHLLLLKGAPERVMDRCGRYLTHTGEEADLTANSRAEWTAAYERFGMSGQRVLGLAYKLLSPGPRTAYLDGGAHRAAAEGMVFLALVALRDPPKPGVSEAVRTCKQAGIRVIVVTGDSALTAEAIARQVGAVTLPTSREIAHAAGVPVEEVPLADSRVGAAVVTGEQIPALSGADWAALLAKPEVVFARTSPEQKLTIVQRLQGMGEVVAVTGDGEE